MKLTRPAWVEIDLCKLRKNIEIIKGEVTPGTKIISVVKANSYGYGADKISKIMYEEGIRDFAVATFSEGVKLRKQFDDIGILILGYTPDYLIEDSIKNRINMTVYNFEIAEKIDEIADKLGKKAEITIAVDSGMNRIGFKPTEKNANIIECISKMKNINIIGMFTHFAVADEDRAYTKYQFNNYMKMVKMLDDRNVEIPLKHVNNSQGIINYREYDLMAVRPGVVQYGSTEDVESKYEGFKELEYIGEVKTEIAHIKTIPAGEKISYGCTFETKRESCIATLPIGYADGILRALSGKIDVLISGKRCPQIGRICMDQMMVDITGIECKIGDEVVIIGHQGDEEITIREVALKVGEIATSYSCHFSPRLPRVYMENGKVESVYDGVLDMWY